MHDCAEIREKSVMSSNGPDLHFDLQRLMDASESCERSKEVAEERVKQAAESSDLDLQPDRHL